MTDSMIVEAIRSVQSNPLNSAQAEAVGASAPVASPEAVARFQAAMATPPVEESARIDSIPFADQASAVWRWAQENRQGLLHRIRALSEMNGITGPSSASLVELQYEVANLSFQQEVVSKVADKTSNAVQTLIKNQ